MMAMPRFFRSSISVNSTSTSALDSDEVGSSMMSTFNWSCSMVLAISTICCWPTRRLSMTSLGSIPGCKVSRISLARRIWFLRSIMPCFLSSLPANMLSATFISGNRFSSWWMMPTPAALASRVFWNFTSLPSSRILPPVGFSIPARIFISVDLPAPFSPMSTLTLPG